MFKDFYSSKLFGQQSATEKFKLLNEEINTLMIEAGKAEGRLLSEEEFELARETYREITDSMKVILERNFETILREKLLPRDMRSFISSTCFALEQATLMALDKFLQERGR